MSFAKLGHNEIAITIDSYRSGYTADESNLKGSALPADPQNRKKNKNNKNMKNNNNVLSVKCQKMEVSKINSKNMFSVKWQKIEISKENSKKLLSVKCPWTVIRPSSSVRPSVV